jgi:hypothetical protein
MFIVRLRVRGQPAPVELPGWADVYTAVVLQNILKCNPCIEAVEVIDPDARPDLFASEGESHARNAQRG